MLDIHKIVGDLREEEYNVTLSGCRYQDIDSRGRRLVATRDLQPKETILTVTTHDFRYNSKNIRNSKISQKLQKSTRCCWLATHLALQAMHQATDLALGFRTEDFLLNHCSILPPGVGQHLSTQLEECKADWDKAQKAFPELDKTAYYYAWFLIRSKGINYVPISKGDIHGSPEMEIILLPILDWFDLSESGCTVVDDGDIFRVETTQACRQDDELHLCTKILSQGKDALLVDFGISPPDDADDILSFDDLFGEALTPEQRQKLSLESEKIRYTLNSQGKRSIDTERRILLLFPDKDYVAEELKLLKKIRDQVRRKRTELEKLQSLDGRMFAILESRWQQYQNRLKKAIDNLPNTMIREALKPKDNIEECGIGLSSGVAAQDTWQCSNDEGYSSGGEGYSSGGEGYSFDDEGYSFDNEGYDSASYSDIGGQEAWDSNDEAHY